VDNRWHHQLSTWEDIAQQFGINDNRYEDFAYLQYLDVNDPFVQDYVSFHLKSTQPKIKGRLSAHLQFWKSLNSPEWLLQIIEKGFTVPFQQKPPRILLPNNKSVLDPTVVPWVRDTIEEYLAAGFLTEVFSVPYCVSPLQVKQTGGKTALIFDMSMVNEYVEKTKFKIESWEEMFEYAKLAVSGIKFDIKKYFYCVDIHPVFRKYFGFMYQMKDGELPRMFTWTVLPYGYTRAPFIARELMKPLITKWRALGANVVVF